MNYSDLSEFTGIDSSEINEIWDDFKKELKECVSNNSSFVYPNILNINPETRIVASGFIKKIIDDENKLDEYIENINETREKNFAFIIAYIYKKTSEGEGKFEDLGEFIIKGEIPKEQPRNPVTGAVMSFPKSLYLRMVFKPNTGIDNPPPKQILKEYRVKLEEVPGPPKNLDTDDGDNVGKRSKLGGFPNWIQEPEEPYCPRCEIPMTFIGQIDSIDSSVFSPSKIQYSFGDAGMIYVFYCFHCLRTESIVQCY